MSEQVVQGDAAIEQILGVLRQRMQEALKDHRSVQVHARAGMKRGSFTEEDGSFQFTLVIEAKL